MMGAHIPYVLTALLATATQATPPVQSTAPAAAAVGSAPQMAVPPVALPTPSGRDQDDVAFNIGKQLRCPVCQGMPIAESPATMAQDMMRLVREKLAAGQSPEEINQYFINRYGEWVMLKPEARGFNWLVWLLPPLSLGLCALWALSYVGRKRPGLAATADPSPVAPQPPDPYLAAIRREVER